MLLPSSIIAIALTTRMRFRHSVSGMPKSCLHFLARVLPVIWASLIFQILIVCVVGMLLWFWLLTIYPASQLGALSFLTPVFGIVFGVVLLGESVEPQFILGAALMLAGIVIVSGWQWFTQIAFQQTRACQVLKAEGSFADGKR